METTFDLTRYIAIYGALLGTAGTIISIVNWIGNCSNLKLKMWENHTSLIFIEVSNFSRKKEFIKSPWLKIDGREVVISNRIKVNELEHIVFPLEIEAGECKTFYFEKDEIFKTYKRFNKNGTLKVRLNIKNGTGKTFKSKETLKIEIT